MVRYLLTPLDMLTTTVGEFRRDPELARGGEAIPTSVAFPCDDSEPANLADDCPLVLHPAREAAGRVLFRLVEAETQPQQPIFSVAVYGQAEGRAITSSSGVRGITFRPLDPCDWFTASVEVTRSLAGQLVEQGYDKDRAVHLAVKMIRERLMFINSFEWMRYRTFVIVSGDEDSNPPN